MNPTQQALQKYYCRRWKCADNWEDSPNEIVRTACEYKTRGTALDVGAGAGRDAIYLARRGFIVDATDIATSGLQRMNQIACKENIPLTAYVADASEWEFNREYDLIVSVLMLNHLSDSAARILIAEMQKHTRVGGICVVHTITKDSDSYRLKAGKNYFYPAADELREMFLGWEILEYREQLVRVEAKEWLTRAVENTEAGLIARKI